MTRTSQTINILLLDDHAMFREGLVRTFEREPEFHIVGQSATVAEAIALLSKEVAIVLLDVDLGRERGLEFVEAAKRVNYEGKILVVTAGLSDAEAVQLVQAGVSGILHKHRSAQALRDAIHKVLGGEAYLEPEYLGCLFRTVDRTRSANRPKLTERDRVVLRGVFQGLTNREIGNGLEISESAVKASLRLLFDKLRVHTRAQLVKVALEQYRDQL